MIVGMYIVAIAGLGWLGLSIFRRAGLGDFIVRLPGFLVLGFLWLVCVMFGSLLLGAFAEATIEQEQPVHEHLSMATTPSNALLKLA